MLLNISLSVLSLTPPSCAVMSVIVSPLPAVLALTSYILVSCCFLSASWSTLIILFTNSRNVLSSLTCPMDPLPFISLWLRVVFWVFFFNCKLL